MSAFTDLSSRVARIERHLGFYDKAVPRSDWSWCKRPGCTRGCYKGTPACMICAGYDPRTGEGMELP